MTNELIKFPEADKTWEDTGEGGMYVYAVVPRPIGFKDNCTVENSIVLTPPDAPVSDIRNFWGDPETAADEKGARDDAARLMDREGFAMKAATVRGLVSLDSLSVDMLAAVYMGSTSRSLKDRTNGTFWEAAWGDLTPSGILLMDRLNIAFGIAPDLLTFLDT
jgi:hypothetical protein